jgi:hypothetical protein
MRHRAQLLSLETTMISDDGKAELRKTLLGAVIK